MQFVTLLVLALLAPPPAAAQAPVAESPAVEARRAAERSLPLLQRSAERWFEERSCTSCHHHALGALALETARGRGLKLDAGLHDKLRNRMRRALEGGRDDALQGVANINGQIGQPYRLIALSALGVVPNGETDARVHFLEFKQHHDGSWPSESHRPPQEDTAFTATALAVRALQLFTPPGRSEELRLRVRRAHDWLVRSAPRDHEDRVMRLFGLVWSGGTSAELAGARDELLRTQREDGGWAQHSHRTSDAYATGSALVALNQSAGLAPGERAYVRGVEFLLRTQLPDGSWLVETRRKTEGLEHFETGFPHAEHQFISYAGTAWAVAALSLTLESRASPVWTGIEPLARPEPEPARHSLGGGFTPLHLAVLYGDVATVEQLLREGADANAASERGVTPLMAAVGDERKARLLLEAGANIDARSARGCTALLLACAHGSGAPVARLLLARGADAKARDGEGSTALCAAALGGDTALVADLLAAGAELERAGAEGATPLMMAVWQHDVAMVRALLSAGASTAARSDAESPLIVATLDGSAPTVRALLAAGAPVDARDPDGSTALHWAATLDWGDGELVDALLSAGADVHASDAAGLTPLALATRHGHARLAELLRLRGALR